MNAQLAKRVDPLHASWRDAARGGREAAAEIAQRLRPVVRAMLRDLLHQRFPTATVLSEERS